jgi:hypothetical protein
VTAATQQATLVAHYGRKPRHIEALVSGLQRSLVDVFGPAFRPYHLEQVHATIVGLEGCRVNDGGAARVRGKRSSSFMELDRLIAFLRGEAFAPIRVQVGGYRADAAYPFRSRDAHPHLRSFSIQGDTAVAIGWPVEQQRFPDSLDRLRRSFQQFGIAHKWHRTADEVDNDLFLVLGRLAPGHAIDAAAVEGAEASLRSRLGAANETTIELTRETLSVVVYEDSDLPPATSRRHALDEPDLAMTLVQIYPSCAETAGSRV